MPIRMPSSREMCSTLMTSAPSAVKNRPAPALASIHVRSTMRTPLSAKGLPCLLRTGVRSGFSDAQAAGALRTPASASTSALCSPRSGARGPVRHGQARRHPFRADLGERLCPVPDSRLARRSRAAPNASSPTFSSGLRTGDHGRPSSWPSFQRSRSIKITPDEPLHMRRDMEVRARLEHIGFILVFLVVEVGFRAELLQHAHGGVERSNASEQVGAVSEHPPAVLGSRKTGPQRGFGGHALHCRARGREGVPARLPIMRQATIDPVRQVRFGILGDGVVDRSRQTLTPSRLQPVDESRDDLHRRDFAGDMIGLPGLRCDRRRFVEAGRVRIVAAVHHDAAESEMHQVARLVVGPGTIVAEGADACVDQGRIAFAHGVVADAPFIQIVARPRVEHDVGGLGELHELRAPSSESRSSTMPRLPKL